MTNRFRWTQRVTLTGYLLSTACSSGGDAADSCEPDDFDGIQGGNVEFELFVSDTEFRPKILTAQNRASVRLTLKNEGTHPLGFSVECLPTPNSDGCPTESCFPEAAQIAPIEPGAELTTEFEVPVPEGSYGVVSEPGASAPRAQFVVK